MHDPLVVAFEISRPWPRTSRPLRLDGSPVQPRRYWPPLVTVWHREPRGHDSGEVCSRRSRPWHLHHWKIQIHAMQELRRRLLTRCAWCGGRHSRYDPVDNSHSWDGPRARWWRGEVGLYHDDCSSISIAHVTCVCVDDLLDDYSEAHGRYGSCARCGLRRGFGTTPDHLGRLRELAAIPAGGRRA